MHAGPASRQAVAKADAGNSADFRQKINQSGAGGPKQLFLASNTRRIKPYEASSFVEALNILSAVYFETHYRPTQPKLS
jgi:hypothetical protein